MDKITQEDFNKAQQVIIDYYAQDFAEINGNDRQCICCGEKISPLDPEHIRFPQSGSYRGGVVDKISAGYGSVEDGNMYIIAICDKCIDKLQLENKIEFAGNYSHRY